MPPASLGQESDTPPPGRIVRATEGDLPRIADLAGVVWRVHYPGIISSGQIEYMLGRMYHLDVMRAELAAGVAYDCLWVENLLVAFASFGRVSIGEMKLYKLYVRPDRQRHGYGSQLLRHVEEIARERSFKTLSLTVNKANFKAIATYRKIGFAIRDSIIVDIGGGFVMDDYVMAREL